MWRPRECNKHERRYSVYSIYSYESTNTDAEGGAAASFASAVDAVGAVAGASVLAASTVAAATAAGPWLALSCRTFILSIARFSKTSALGRGVVTVGRGEVNLAAFCRAALLEAVKESRTRIQESRARAASIAQASSRSIGEATRAAVAGANELMANCKSKMRAWTWQRGGGGGGGDGRSRVGEVGKHLVHARDYVAEEIMGSKGRSEQLPAVLTRFIMPHRAGGSRSRGVAGKHSSLNP